MNKFFKKERLCSRKQIDKLFVDGKSFLKYPLRVTFSLEESQNNFICEVLIIVPKKRLKRAIDRNLMKRRIREAYRKNKNDFYTGLKEKNLHTSLAILYVSSELTEYTVINIAIQKAFQSVKEIINNV